MRHTRPLRFVWRATIPLLRSETITRPHNKTQATEASQENSSDGRPTLSPASERSSGATLNYLMPYPLIVNPFSHPNSPPLHSPSSTPPHTVTLLPMSTSGDNNSTMQSVIDHRSFPHIISSILTYSSVPALVNFRKTGRAFRNSKEIKRLIDGEVYRHLVLTVEGDGPKERWWAIKYILLSNVELPYGYTPIDIHADHSTIHSLLGHTKILDIVVNDFRLNTYLPFPSLEIIRVFGSGSQYFTLPDASTVIVFPGIIPRGNPRVLLGRARVKRLIFPTCPSASYTVESVSTGLKRVHWRQEADVEELVLLHQGEMVDDSATILALIFDLNNIGYQRRSTDGPSGWRLHCERVVIVGISPTLFKTWARLSAPNWTGQDHMLSDLDKCSFYTFDEYIETLKDDVGWLSLVNDPR